MSRLIVKQLPKNITEDKLRNIFGQKGVITDIQLKYTKEGVFRQFAFVGYQSEEQAETALKYFNNSCIQTSRIKVELCAPLGSENKPKAWSKYSKESSAYKKKHGLDKIEKTEREERNKKSEKEKKNFIEEIIGEHKNDPIFVEFMQTHSKNRMLWDNDAKILNENNENEKDSEKIDDVKNVSSKIAHSKKKISNYDEKAIISKSDSENENDEEKNELENKSLPKLAEKEISDLEYMKSLIKKKEYDKNRKESSKTTGKTTDLFTIKIHNLPYQLKRSDIQKFFKPIKPYSVRLPSKVHGFCYVGFKTEKEFQKAMLKDKSFIKKKQVFFSDFTEKNKVTKLKKQADDEGWSEENIEEHFEDLNKNVKWIQQEENVKNEEDISESGKLFFRNLAYTTTEDDLQNIFEKYGSIAEINLPVDPLTRQIKGFGTVSFMMPEHAVQAFSELDGTMFQGRLLHLIPGKNKDKEDNKDSINENDLGYKARKALDLKKSANQSHNWNTLFLGANAVADILSKRLETRKETLFDTEAGGYSAAVRLALGETEIVLETKKFLEENDVQLSVFDSVPKKRSKTVILVKNLPAETTITELKSLFEKFGPIGRFLLPPAGITALIEYLDPSEARKAFKKLAYSKFKNLPLYLEWAPENTFKTKLDSEKVKENADKIVKKVENMEEEKLIEPKRKGKKLELESTTSERVVREELSNNADKSTNNKENNETEDEPPESDTTIFLRNLNFKTKEDTIRNHFKNLGAIHMIQVATKKDPQDPKNRIPLGYGFIQFKKKQIAQKVLKEMQFTEIEGNQVELKRSDRILKEQVKSIPKKAMLLKQTGTKILVKNIPFQAKPKEVEDIFKTFGELRSVRLPKKMTPGENTHRGFGFVDFLTKNDAKKAFEALCQSTHLYDRRLVLEWAAVDDNDVSELRKRTAEHFTGGTQSNAKKSRKAVFDTSKINYVQNNDVEDNDSDD